MSERKLREALEEIVAVASGERQVAVDDTEGMEWIDKRARKALAEASQRSGTGWLIERRDRAATEWLVCDSGGFEWTPDPLKPIRFCRREDADQVASLFDDIDVHITEHQWGL